MPLKTLLSKQDSGKLGEAIVIAWLHSQGLKDAHHLNLKQNNFPIDLLQDHASIEVKTGLVSNRPDAQKWRLTIGQPSKSETERLRTVSAADKAQWNARKQQLIVGRKKKALANISRALGKPVKAQTITLLLDPDKKLADIFVFDGWHDSLRWRAAETAKAYRGTVQYG